MTDLFTPATMGSIAVENRVFMAPLTRNRAHNDTDIPTDLAIEYYAQRASSGFILSEATQISPLGKGYDSTPGIYTPEQVAVWKKITEAVHDKGGKIGVQLWHVGRISHTSVMPDGRNPLAPSAIKASAQTFAGGEMVDTSKPDAMTQDDIDNTIKDYVHAVKCAKEAGFDGIEIHAANGYLINQFLCDSSNKRDDKYGGSIENRARILFEILDAVTDIYPADKIGIRLSPTGTFNDAKDSNPKDHYTYVINKLNSYGLAYLHMVERFPGVGADNDDLKILSELVELWNGFYIANGDYDALTANMAIESGYADAITFGRTYIANPDLMERLKSGAQLNEPDQDTFYGGGAKGYIDYPFMDGTVKKVA